MDHVHYCLVSSFQLEAVTLYDGIDWWNEKSQALVLSLLLLLLLLLLV